MNTYLVYGHDAFTTIPGVAPYCSWPLEAFKREGVVVVGEAEFALWVHRDKRVHPHDKVINFFVSDVNCHLIYDAVPPPNRWCWLIDERSQADGSGSYAGRLQHFAQHRVSHAVITYPSFHANALLAAGVKLVIMPICVPARRMRTAKTKDVILSGHTGEAYPIRTHLSSLLRSKMPHRAHLLEPGIYVDGPYYDELDVYQMGVVCRAGNRDRMVAKYVEFGACHVLPIGDCPAYMPKVMQAAMLDVSKLTNEETVAEVERLLSSPAELFARQEAYSEATHRYFDVWNNAKRVVSQIAAT